MTGTTTLPLPPGISGLIGLAALILLIFGALSLMGRDWPGPVWGGLSTGWLALAVVGALAWTGLLALVLVAAVTGVLGMIKAPDSAGLGLGGLLVALLGAPFLIWTTVLKDRTVRFQKEGHMTDRISKAVEQLGAEKEVTRLMRNATFTIGGETQTIFEGRDAEKVPDGAKDIVRGEWQIVKRSVPNLEVRIGAILSLERIAQDSTIHDRGRDHVRVMEILCAYIRHNAPASDAQDHPWGDWVPLKDDPTLEERAEHEARRTERFGGQGQVRAWARTLKPPRADIAEALKVIGRRNRYQLLVEAAWPDPPGTDTRWPFDNAPALYDDEARRKQIYVSDLGIFVTDFEKWEFGLSAYKGYRLDLNKTKLQRADLSGYLLQGANLDGACLQGANLSWTRLEGVRLKSSQLGGANMTNSHLQGANLECANLEEAVGVFSRLQGVNFELAHLEGADLKYASLECARINNANLECAMLREARLGGADVSWARLPAACLVGAIFEGGFFDGFPLDDANIAWSQFRSVDLSRLRLNPDQIAKAFGDASVTLPDGVSRPAHWPAHSLDNASFETQYQLWRANPATYRPPTRAP